MRRAVAWSAGLAATSALVLTSCASYQPLPLSGKPDLSHDVPRVTVPASELHPPGVSSHTVDPAKGLDMTGAAIVAVINNPQLRAARAKLGDARAQVFSAGLLSDPQLALANDRVTGGAGVTSAFNAGLSYAINMLITRHATLGAARANLRSVDLDVLWQEWQVAQKARLSVVQVRALEQERDLLSHYRNLYAGLNRRSQRALAEGNITLDVAGTNLVALLDVEARLGKLEQDLDKARHQLTALLGLAPDVTVPLRDSRAEAPSFTQKTLQAALDDLPRRRPDLLALAAGYRSQEDKLREAILGQFPSLSVGVTRARDVSAVYTTGLNITLNLPFFDGNRGKIAIERATRARLHEEYQSRVDQSWGEVDQIWAEYGHLERQLTRAERALPQLGSMAANARRAYANHDLAAATYLTFEQAYLKKQLDVIGLRQALLGAGVGLQTLLGAPIGTGAR